MKHLATVAHQVALMSDEQRQALADSMPVVTVEGHPLSFRNNVLLAMQADIPVTIVAGFRQWLAAGRAVKKGEKALYILIPCMKKGDDGQESPAFFREAAIFDVSQTNPL